MSSSTNPIADNRTLPKKENDLFRSLVKCYEEKQYKKGIKNADQILKKYPLHGETQAMKGLILNSMGKKEESYELVKNGLKNDVRSHVCWHVFGLLYRSDHNYKEAIKCYLNALRIDKDNQNILRDLSFLQIQMRDMSGFADTRRKLLILKPSNKIQWITYAVSLYCNQDYSTACDVLEKFFTSSLEEKIPYEQSELYLFQNRCLEAAGKYQEALDHLETSKSSIVDLLSWRIKKGELYIKLGRFPEAISHWLELVREQPDNYRFHSGYQISFLQLLPELANEMLLLQRLELPSVVLPLSSDQISSLRENYETVLPKSAATTRISLSLYPISTHQQEFKQQLVKYIQNGLRKGIPNLYNDLCSLIRIPDPLNPERMIYAKDTKDYENHPITVLLIEILNEFIESLSSNGTFFLQPSDDAIVEAPTALLWCYYLRCHIFSVSGRHSEALIDIEKSIDHTPTSLDSLAKRARVLKNCGDYAGAAEQMNYCRSLDLQDRYVNNKATKYYLRANRVEDGMNTIAMFTKHDGDSQQTLFDLQCIWYELEMGEAYHRKEQFGPALKKFYAIEKHFSDFIEDQFDFHAFSMRKTTLRAYLDMIETSDTILAHKFFQRAGQNVLEIMLKRLNLLATKDETPEVDPTSTMTAAERKKEKNKQKKLAKKEESAAAAIVPALGGPEEKKGSNKKASNVVADDDPVGSKILEKDILDEAVRWCHLLTKGGHCKDPLTLALVCEVMLKKNKYIIALRCLTSGFKIDSNHPQLNYQLIQFTRQFYSHVGLISSPASGDRKALVSVIEDVVREKLSILLSGEGEAVLNSYIENYLAKIQNNSISVTLFHRLIGAKIIASGSSSNTEPLQNQQRAVSFLFDQFWNVRGINYKNVLKVFQVLESEFRSVEGATNTFKEQIQSKFPSSNLFNPIGLPIHKGVVDLELIE